MQAIINQGKNYLYIDKRLLVGYNDNDELLILISKDKCEERLFSAQTKICANRVSLCFEIENCIDKRGRWSASIQNMNREELYQTFIQIHIKE